jgi:RNA polymerase sigma-70 factor (ECF subfamily)
MEPGPANQQNAERSYREAAEEFGPALVRLARVYEADPDKRRDLVQEIHLALWRSFTAFDRRCSLRTWVYRVAHNAAISYVIRQKRAHSEVLVGLEELQALPADRDSEHEAGRQEQVARLTRMIQRLKPLDRQVILSYVEGLAAAEIAEITGLSAGNVSTKIHRIKAILAREFQEGAGHGE